MKEIEKGMGGLHIRPVMALMKCLLAGYLLSGLLLVITAFVLYRIGLTEKTASLIIVGIYVSSCFVCGFLAGKVFRNRKFVWGLLEGVLYFLILAVISLACHTDLQGLGNDGLTTWILCAASGTLGGMLS